MQHLKENFVVLVGAAGGCVFLLWLVANAQVEAEYVRVLAFLILSSLWLGTGVVSFWFLQRALGEVILKALMAVLALSLLIFLFLLRLAAWDILSQVPSSPLSARTPHG